MSNNYDQLWSRCLSVIKDNISEASFNTWFAPIVPLKYENNIIVLQVPSQFFVEYIEEKYIDLLRMTLYREVGVGTRLEYRVLIVHGLTFFNSRSRNTGVAPGILS